MNGAANLWPRINTPIVPDDTPNAPTRRRNYYCGRRARRRARVCVRFLCAYCCWKKRTVFGRRTKKLTFSTPPRRTKVATLITEGTLRRRQPGVAWAKRSRARVTGERGKVVYPRRKRGRARVSIERGRSRCRFIVIFRFPCTAAGTYMRNTSRGALGSWRAHFFLRSLSACSKRPAQLAGQNGNGPPTQIRRICTENNASGSRASLTIDSVVTGVPTQFVDGTPSARLLFSSLLSFRMAVEGATGRTLLLRK